MGDETRSREELSREIARLQERRRQAEALFHISEAARLDSDIETFSRTVVDEVKAASGFPIVSFERYDAARGEMVFLANRGLSTDGPGRLRVVPLDRTLSGNVVKTGQSLVVPDALSRPEYADEGLRQFQVVTFLCVPIRVKDRIWGTLALAHPQAVPLDDFLIAWLETLARSLAAHLERREMLATLRESEGKLRILFDHAGEGILVAELKTRQFRIANPAICRMFGYSQDEILKLDVNRIHPPEALPKVIAEFEAQARGDKVLALALPCLRKDGSVFLADIATTMVELDGCLCNVGFFKDVTEREAMEQQKIAMERRMLHTQKLESLGLLAGGIAHDFNNILMSVMGHANLARLRLPPGSRALDNIQLIEQATARAADLARQLLAYSGRGKFVLEALDLSRVVEDMTPLLTVSIDKKVRLVSHLAAPLPAVEADPTQVRQIVMNLVINASEAIGDKSGVIHVKTGVCDCQTADLQDSWTTAPLPPGRYVFLEVADSGCGMDEHVKARVFDPFFSTKFTGRGLGLAAVLGIVRGHHGGVRVASEPGRGTTFRVLLPASIQAPNHASPHPAEESWKGSGTALLVDDEEEIRVVGRCLLEELGFAVMEASDGHAAIHAITSQPHPPAVVLLDLTMPSCDGEEAFREIRRLFPAIPVIMMSGFSEQEVTQKFAGRGLAGFVQKPFSLTDLRQILRTALSTFGPTR